MTSNKKIIIVGPAYPLRGGIANLNESLAYHLQQKGFEVEIVSFSLQYPSILFPGKNQKDEHSPPSYSLNIHPLINSVNPISWLKAARYIISKKPALVIFRYWIPFMAPCLGFIGKKLKRKNIDTIAIVDNFIPHEKRIGDELLNSYFLTAFSKFFTLSASVAQDIKQHKPHAIIHTAPHPVYDMFGEPVSKTQAKKNLGIPTDSKIILFFGFVRKYKGLDLLLKALPSIKDPQIKLLIAGEFYDNKNDYLKLIKNLNIENRMIIHDKFIPTPEVKNYFCAADIVAQPYRTATQSGVTQIAYHFEVPMLVTRVGGLPEIVEHGKTGYVVPVHPEKIAQALHDFFTHQRYEEMKKQVKQQKYQFSWDYFVNQLLKMASNLHQNT